MWCGHRAGGRAPCGSEVRGVGGVVRRRGEIEGVIIESVDLKRYWWCCEEERGIREAVIIGSVDLKRYWWCC